MTLAMDYILALFPSIILITYLLILHIFSYPRHSPFHTLTFIPSLQLPLNPMCSSTTKRFPAECQLLIHQLLVIFLFLMFPIFSSWLKQVLKYIGNHFLCSYHMF